MSAGSEAWTQISPTGDAGNREAHQAVYQPDYSGTDDRMIVFRGWNGSYLADVWELTLPESGSSVWTDKTPGTDYQPIKIGYGVSSSGVYDPLNMRALFIGGYDGTYYENSVYAFDLSSNPSTLAYAVLNDVRYLRERDASSMIFDSTNNQMIMFGGASRGLPGGYSYHLGETWKMNTSGTPVWRDAGAGFAPIPRELTGLKNTYFLQQLFTLLARESGSVFNLREISRKFSVSFSTVQTHLWYLHQAYLITMLRKYSRGGMAQARTQPKIHLADTGIMASLANSGREILQDQQLTGRFVETLVTATLRFNRYSAELFFWRDQRNEIDLVISSGKTVIPLEVKYRNYAMKETYSKLLDFTKKYNSPFALVLTKKEFDQKDMLIFLPAWLFCLLV